MPPDDFHPLSFYTHKNRALALGQWTISTAANAYWGLEQRRVPRPSRFVEHPDPFARCSARRFFGAELEPPDHHGTSGGTNFNTCQSSNRMPRLKGSVLSWGTITPGAFSVGWDARIFVLVPACAGIASIWLCLKRFIAAEELQSTQEIYSHLLRSPREVCGNHRIQHATTVQSCAFAAPRMIMALTSMCR